MAVKKITTQTLWKYVKYNKTFHALEEEAYYE
jgi:hypothetical protein